MKHIIRVLDIKSRAEGILEFGKIGATVDGQRIMVEKLFPIALKVKGLKPTAANILKQEMLARGGDVVTSRDVLLGVTGETDVIIEGNFNSLKDLIKKLKMQPFGLSELSRELDSFLKGYKVNSWNRSKYIIGNTRFTAGSEPLVMGILNVTPDSFYDGGRFYNRQEALRHVEEMVKEGADIIDIGGMSSRPGAKPVSTADELKRTIPIIKNINKNYDILISIDTYRSEVAEEAVSAGAAIINDISALSMDDKMVSVAVSGGASVILMHMQGTPENMQDNPHYDDVIDEIYEYLYQRACYAIDSGISSDKIIIDPGIGFGKNLDHNITILNKIKEFSFMGFPVLVGPSRKSFLGKVLDLPGDERLEGSIAAAVWSVINNVSIVRVHDVGETVRALKIINSILSIYG
jgi:dihydropteroate synthase